MKFRIGQKVICSIPFNVKRKYIEQLPEKGRTYTIRGFTTHNGITGILLEEIVNPRYRYKDGVNEAAFSISNFRPIDNQDSAIEEILAKFPITEEVIDAKIKKEKQPINK